MRAVLYIGINVLKISIYKPDVQNRIYGYKILFQQRIRPLFFDLIRNCELSKAEDILVKAINQSCKVLKKYPVNSKDLICFANSSLKFEKFENKCLVQGIAQRCKLKIKTTTLQEEFQMWAIINQRSFPWINSNLIVDYNSLFLKTAILERKKPKFISSMELGAKSILNSLRIEEKPSKNDLDKVENILKKTFGKQRKFAKNFRSLILAGEQAVNIGYLFNYFHKIESISCHGKVILLSELVELSKQLLKMDKKAIAEIPNFDITWTNLIEITIYVLIALMKRHEISNIIINKYSLSEGMLAGN